MENIGKREKKGLDKKIIFLVSIFITMALTIVLISYFGNKIVNGSRAYVSGERLWTEAQKEAVLHLVRYIEEEDEEFHREFQHSLEVIYGDRRARETLMSSDPDYQVAYQELLKGNNYPEDIPQMIWLFNNFQDISYIRRAIDIWMEVDKKIAMLDSLADRTYGLIEANNLTESRKNELLDKIYTLDQELTRLGRSFSNEMSQAARWASSTIFWATVILMLALILIAGIATVRTLQNIKTINRKLDATQSRFRNVMDSSRDVLYEMDLETGKYLFMSASVKDMIGFSVDKMLEEGPSLIVERMHPEDRKRMEAELEAIQKEGIEDHFKTKTEFRVLTKDDEYIWVSNKRTLLYDEEGKPRGVVGSVRDISERKQYEEELDKSLKEKEVLLKEIHHRVKNNLAIISGLLELQKEGLDPETINVFEESQSRIHSIAMVHEKLYNSDTLSDISMSEYIDDLADTIKNAYSSELKGVKIEKDFDEVMLDITEAIPCGLIFNELVNNVYKHAFDRQDKGTLKITLREDGGRCILAVADNGKGLPKDFDLEGSQSLGMKLVRTLIRQLGTDLEINSNDWTEFKFSFECS